MTNETIKIKKGLDIEIRGTAIQEVEPLTVTGDFALMPDDHVGVAPRLLVAEGDTVLAGSPLYEDKNNTLAHFVSPVSGTVKAIVRGEKRALLAVVVSADSEQKSVEYKKLNPLQANRDELTQHLVDTGLWTLIKQRPFGIIPHTPDAPKAVFVSVFDSSPLPVDYTFALKGREEDFQWGIDALHRLSGKVYLSLHSTQANTFLAKTQHAEIHYFEGCHPAGLVGTQIAKISPINQGERVWTVEAQDIAILGHALRCGEYKPERMVAVGGPSVAFPHYYRTLGGVQVSMLTPKMDDAHVRYICGDVLSGISVAREGFLSAACSKVSVIAEGDQYDFLGWLRPNFKKYSLSRTFLSGFFARCKKSTVAQRCAIDTGYHGSHRPLFVTGEFETLTPLNIYPMQLIKSCMIGDIDQMISLGLLEVEPEDLALCEFADTSKTEIQKVIREGLELIRKNSN